LEERVAQALVAETDLRGRDEAVDRLEPVGLGSGEHFALGEEDALRIVDADIDRAVRGDGDDQVDPAVRPGRDRDEAAERSQLDRGVAGAVGPWRPAVAV